MFVEGLISPTRGSVDIMIKETAFCFSFDVFFEDLTVEENLELFARVCYDISMSFLKYISRLYWN